MAVPETTARVAEAEKLAATDPSRAEEIYKDVLSQNPGSNEAAIKNYETALVGLGELYRDQKNVDALAELVKQARSVMSTFARAKTSKLGMAISRSLVRGQWLTHHSPTTTRSLHHHTKHDRHPDRRHQVMYRMGRLRAERLPTAKPRDPPCRLVHAEAVLL